MLMVYMSLLNDDVAHDDGMGEFLDYWFKNVKDVFSLGEAPRN